ncbi:MAG: hypothetical protein HW398_539, partial [Acidobacteria bacterium]|nr:hypothetical protein [Acidobacteriota bacterium]
MADTPSAEKDPVVGQSLSFPLLISALLLVVTLLWSLFDETFWQRPWKGYQEQFVGLYTAFLKSKAIPEQTAREQEIRNSADYQRLQGELDAAEQAAGTQVADIDRQSRLLAAQILILNRVFAEARGEVQALTYNLETASSDGAKASFREDIEEARREPREADLPSGEGNGAVERETFESYEELETKLNELKAKKAELEGQRVRLTDPSREARLRRDAYLRDQLGGLTSEQLNGLVRRMETFRVDINSRQIHVADVDLVDRCEACHLAVREPLTIAAADMGGRKEFASHPTPDLLRIHDPERFGCTPCHGGNGRATTSVEKAHGNYLHWLWPLYGKENMEAGCQQCHTRDMVLNHANTLNMGKNLFDHRGCVGCHRYEGYDTEPEEFLEVQRTIRQKQQEKRENLLEAQRSDARSDRPETSNEDARRLRDAANNLRVSSSGIDAEIVELIARSRNLLKERKKVAPS